MLDFNLKFVVHPREFSSLTARLNTVPALALDIETVNWWDRRGERVSLIQIAYREGARLRVAVVDAFAGLPLEQFRPCLESSAVTKAIHNAANDAVRRLEKTSLPCLTPAPSPARRSRRDAPDSGCRQEASR